MSDKNMQRIDKNSESSQIDRGLVAMFLKLSPEERLRANDIAAGTILELRNASRDSKDKQRLLVLEETLRQLEEESGSDETLT
jgi:hypothetical protein